MGMFSFLKEVGEKLFGAGKAQAATPAAPTDDEFAKALTAKVQKLGLNVTGLVITYSNYEARVQGTVPSQAEREKVILAVGNSEGVGKVNDELKVPNPEPEAKFYTVVKGDTLSKIAKQFYGDPNKYPQIFEANKPMLTHPDKIYPGQVLRIP